MLYVWLDRTYRAKMDLAFVGDQENCSAMTDTILSTCITMLDGQHALKENCILGNLRQQRWDNCRYILTGSYITQWKISGQYITKMKSQLCHTTRLSLKIYLLITIIYRAFQYNFYISLVLIINPCTVIFILKLVLMEL